MLDTVTVHVYKASSSRREYTLVFGENPGQESVEEYLRSFEGDIHISDRFPLFSGDVFSQNRGADGSQTLDCDLTVVGGEVIPAGTPIIFKTYTDILWVSAEDYDDREYEN